MDDADRLSIGSHRNAEASPDGRDTRQLKILNEIARIATEDLELRPMLQRITDALARTFSWPFVALVRVDSDRKEFVCEALTSLLPTKVDVGYRRGLGTGVVGEVAETGRAILIDDVLQHPNYVETMPATRSELCVPVHHGGKLVAILNLESLRVAEFHNQLPLLETVAEQIAGAIASAELYEQLKRRASLLEMIAEVSRIALEADDLQSLLDRVVDYVQRRTGVEVVAILMLDRESNEVIQAAHAGEIAVEKGRRWPLTRGIVGRSIRRNEPELVLDVKSDPDYASINDRVVSEYVVPIRFRGDMLGVFNIESTKVSDFGVENIVAFRALADQLAGAIRLSSVNQRLSEAKREIERHTEDLEKANRRLERLTKLDGLTGIANRRHFDEKFLEEWRRARRGDADLSLIMIDIDFFKRYNDRYGHQAGDRCLERVASGLAAQLHRAGDLVARYGGEEFVVLLPGADHHRAEHFAEKLRWTIESLGIAHELNPDTRLLTISLGVATGNPAEKAVTARELVQLADRALYAAKQGGRNRVVVA